MSTTYREIHELTSGDSVGEVYFCFVVDTRSRSDIEALQARAVNREDKVLEEVRAIQDGVDTPFGSP